jgi:hypothetical protein
LQPSQNKSPPDVVKREKSPTRTVSLGFEIAGLKTCFQGAKRNLLRLKADPDYEEK